MVHVVKSVWRDKSLLYRIYRGSILISEMRSWLTAHQVCEELNKNTDPWLALKK